MENKNLVLLPSSYYYPQIPQHMQFICFNGFNYQQNQIANCPAQAVQSNSYNMIPQNIPSHHYSSYLHENDINYGDTLAQKSSCHSQPFTEIQQQIKTNEIQTNGCIEDDIAGCDQITYGSCHSYPYQLKSLINNSQRSSTLIQTQIIIQEVPSYQQQEENDKNKEKFKQSQHQSTEQLSKQEEKQTKRVTAHWKYINLSDNNEHFQRKSTMLNINNIQPSQKQNQQQQLIVKIQPETLHDKMKNEYELYEKKCKNEDNQNEVDMDLHASLNQSEQSNANQKIREDNQQQLSGNLCKNLMRAFNKFVQHYNFQDQSIKVSLFRFLERNTYSNLQMLKIFHNPRYKQIFLEFVKGGALIWLQQSRVLDIEAHINLLQKIIEGDVSQIGIKKRKNVSKVITKNIKKKSCSTINQQKN